MSQDLSYGFHQSIPFAEYQAIPALNYSTLKWMQRSPMHFRHHADNQVPATEPQLLGMAAHKVILEPEMTGDFAIWEGGVRRGKEWDWFCAQNEGKTLLRVKERDLVAFMSAAVRVNPVAFKYLRHGRKEMTMLWRDPAARRNFKGRADNLTEIDGEPFIVDLKSTRDCRDFRFGADAFKFGYYIQAAMYADGFFYLTGTLPQFVIIAIESKPPHESAVYRLRPHILQKGHDDYAKLLVKLAECEKSGKWPAAVDSEQDLELPSYAYEGGGFDMDDLELIAR